VTRELLFLTGVTTQPERPRWRCQMVDLMAAGGSMPTTTRTSQSKLAVPPTGLDGEGTDSKGRKTQFSLSSKRLIEDMLREQQAKRSNTQQKLQTIHPHSARGRILSIVQHQAFQVVTCLLVIINAIYIGFETAMRRCQEDSDTDAWYAMTVVFALVFSFELGLRLTAERLAFFSDAWNLFDTVLVVSSVADTLILRHLAHGNTLDLFVALRVLRLLRLARIFRLIRFCKELWFLVEGILSAVHTLGWAWLLILFMTYVPAIFVTRMFGQEHPEDAFLTEHFGTVARSMYSLFQVMSVEGWAEIARTTIQVAPWSWLFFILFIFATTFAVMHVVVAVIVQNTLEHASHRNEEEEHAKDQKDQEVLMKIIEVFKATDADGDGEVTRDEFLMSLKNKLVMRSLHQIDVDVRQAENLFDILDYDDSGSLDASEFIEGMLMARGEAQAKEVLAVQCDLWKTEKRILTTCTNFEQDIRGSLSALTDTVARFQEDVGKVFDVAPGLRMSRTRTSAQHIT